MKQWMKLLICLVILAGCDAQRIRRQDVYEAISRQTMRRLLLFVETDDAVLDCYRWDEANAYYQLDINCADSARELLKEPTLMMDVINQPGFGQRIGLTDCEEVFSMIRTDENLFEKAIELAKKEVDESRLSEIINQEYTLLGLEKGGE